jgi:hypothetical protein
MRAPASVRWLTIVAAFGGITTASAQGASVSEIAAAAATDSRTLWVTNAGTDSGVCGSRGSPCRSISQAMENANDGDTIWVGAGRYGHISGDPNFAGPGDEHPTSDFWPGNGFLDLPSGCMICIAKALHIYSIHGAATTLIEADPAAPFRTTVAIVHDGVVFGAKNNGFTITGGNDLGLGVAVGLGELPGSHRKNIIVAGNVDVKDRTGFAWDGQYLTPPVLRGCDEALGACLRTNQIVFTDNQAIDTGTGFTVTSNPDIGPGPVILRNNLASGAGIGFAARGGGVPGTAPAAPNLVVRLLGNVAIHSGTGFDLYVPGAIEGNTASANTFGFYVIPGGVGFRGNSVIGNSGPGLIMNVSPGSPDLETLSLGGFGVFSRNNFFGNDRNRPPLVLGPSGVVPSLNTGPSAHCGVLNVGALAALPGLPASVTPPPVTTLEAAGNFWGSRAGTSATGAGDEAGGACDQNGGKTIATPFAVTAFPITSWP